MAVIVTGLLTIFIKPLLAAATRNYFAYENAWDEPTYLSYQGGLGMKSHPLRWASGHLVTFFHEVGMSGAIQNLMLDSLTFLIVGFVVYNISNADSRTSFSGRLRDVWFGLFGMVLFNRTNPLLTDIFPYYRHSDTVWVVAWENYLPLIRSPEPQLSLILVAIAVIVFYQATSRYRWSVLIIPVPFLYFPVLLAYCYSVGVFLIYQFLVHVLHESRKVVTLAVAANALVFVSMAICIRLAAQSPFAGEFLEWGIANQFVRFGHRILLSPNLLFTMIACFLVWIAVNQGSDIKVRNLYRNLCITAVGLQVFIVDQQLISGVTIHPNGLQDVAGTAVASFMLCMLVRSAYIYERIRMLANFFCVVVSSWILLCLSAWIVVSAKLFVFLPQKTSEPIKTPTVVNNDLSMEDIKRIVKDPLHALITNEQAASRLALAAPRLLAPPFAYQYRFPWFAATCAEAFVATKEARRVVALGVFTNVLEKNVLTDLEGRIQAVDAVMNKIPHPGRNCGYHEKMEGDFYLITSGSTINIRLR